LSIVPDLIAAWAGATGGNPGLVLVAGTGAVAYGRDSRGGAARAGGWGPLFGDEGGGYWIGCEVLRAVSRSVDGRARETSLIAALRKCENGFDTACSSTPDEEELLRLVYRDAWQRERIADLARVAASHAAAGDDAAKTIMERAAAELGSLIDSVVRRLDGGSRHLQLYAVGGLIDAGPPLLGPLKRWVAAVQPFVEWSKPLGSPLEGALHLAAREPEA
jgi:N-acetylglucosamine kinase-like BadF-type ATPase